MKQLEFEEQSGKEDDAAPVRGLPEVYVRPGSLVDGWDMSIQR